MSVLIKDMEIPKNCNECKLDLRTDICKAFCEWNAEHPYSIRATDRLPDCPLSEAPEPCEDTIYRQAAIDAIDEKSDEIYKTKQKGATYPHDDFFQGMAYAENIIKQLPPAQSDQRWIPCSEMEPKKSGHYLCIHGGTGIVSPDYYTTQEQVEELFADSEDEYLDLEKYIGWTSKNVIAWMPRPEPYEKNEKI